MGSVNGWVENSAKIFRHTSKDGIVSDDYHTDVTGPKFRKYLEELLPTLPPNSVIVTIKSIFILTK